MSEVVDCHNDVVPPEAVAALARSGNPFQATIRGRMVEHHDGIAFPLAAEMDDVEAKLASLDRWRRLSTGIIATPARVRAPRPP